MQKNDCIFCLIVQGKAPAHEVWSSETHLAFLSIFPNTEGVSVVIPRQHHGSYIFDHQPEVICDLMTAAQQVARKLDSYFEDVGRTGVVFEGFGVDHLHAKLFPLHGTGNLENWQPIESSEKNTLYAQYPGFIASNDSKRADDAKLAALAKQLRRRLK